MEGNNEEMATPISKRLSYSRSEQVGRAKFSWVYRGKLNGIIDIAVKRVEKSMIKVDPNDFLKGAGHQNIILHFSTKADFEFMWVVQ